MKLMIIYDFILIYNFIQNWHLVLYFRDLTLNL